jgi:hypothetical protein
MMAPPDHLTKKKKLLLHVHHAEARMTLSCSTMVHAITVRVPFAPFPLLLRDDRKTEACRCTVSHRSPHALG